MLCHKCNAEIPDTALLCDVCGAVVKTAPTEETRSKPHRRINLLRLAALCAAAAVALVGVIGILVSNSPRGVAKRYVQATVEGDYKASSSLCVEDMRQWLEQEATDAERAAVFQNAEAQGQQIGLDLSVDTSSQYYKALRAIVEETYTQTYGEGYTVSYAVKETEDMSVREYEAYCTLYRDSRYVDVDQLKIGKNVTVTVTIEGDYGTHTYDYTLSLLKYKGAWKVVPDTYTSTF